MRNLKGIGVRKMAARCLFPATAAVQLGVLKGKILVSLRIFKIEVMIKGSQKHAELVHTQVHTHDGLVLW